MEWLNAASSFKVKEKEILKPVVETQITKQTQPFLQQFEKYVKRSRMIYDGELVADYFNRNSLKRKKLTRSLELKDIKFDASDILMTFLEIGDDSLKEATTLRSSEIVQYVRIVHQIIGIENAHEAYLLLANSAKELNDPIAKPEASKRYYEYFEAPEDTKVQKRTFNSEDWVPFYHLIQDNPFDLTFTRQNSLYYDKNKELLKLLDSDSSNEYNWLTYIHFQTKYKTAAELVEITNKALTFVPNSSEIAQIYLHNLHKTRQFTIVHEEVKKLIAKNESDDLTNTYFDLVEQEKLLPFSGKLSLFSSLISTLIDKTQAVLRLVEFLLNGGFNEMAFAIYRSNLELNLMKEKGLLNAVGEYVTYLKEVRQGLGDYEERYSFFEYRFKKAPTKKGLVPEKTTEKIVSYLEDLPVSFAFYNYRPLSLALYEENYDTVSYVGSTNIEPFLFIAKNATDKLINNILMFTGNSHIGNCLRCCHTWKTEENLLKPKSRILTVTRVENEQLIIYLSRLIEFCDMDVNRKQTLALLLLEILALGGNREEMRNVLKKNPNDLTLFINYAKWLVEWKEVDEAEKIISYFSKKELSKVEQKYGLKSISKLLSLGWTCTSAAV